MMTLRPQFSISAFHGFSAYVPAKVPKFKYMYAMMIHEHKICNLTPGRPWLPFMVLSQSEILYADI
jgi:hypothetical protein